VSRTTDEAARGVLKAFGSSVLRPRVVRRAVAAAAATGRRSLVLVFHRLLRDGETSGGVVPAVPASTFRSQIEQLLDIGDIVPLASILEGWGGHGRPCFAITLDDDYRSHHDVALPILREAGVPATFFLGGRSLHGLGLLWFEILDRILVAEAPSRLARDLGMSSEADPAMIAEACEGDPRLQAILEEKGAGGDGHLTRDEIVSLSSAGMTVGFHTLHHPRLTGLSRAQVRSAVTSGRAELEDLLGRPLTEFAYPHGKADPVVAAIVRDAGFRTAWTGRPAPVTRRSEPHLLGRWEAGSVTGHPFIARALARLWKARP
jgi:peptidoglycan/xylan/chitin deacetylase (PgdA/CDA1 family)